ncbi:MAG: DUF3990 domain-containing protein [Clostridia bacterium]|nr:DUF3990 domain-containing protein [Clostridia bacterium]
MLYRGGAVKIIIKQIRNHLNMSQSEFADWIGVSFATVNRWENGHAVPNRLAQTKLYEVCKEKMIPLYAMILDKINQAVRGISLEKDRILLYHGSKSGVVGDIEPKSRKQCDFGKGFYMGTDPNQPLTLICDYEESKFYIVSVCTNMLKSLEINTDIEWAMLVAYNRGKMEKIKDTDLYNKYRDMMKDKDLIIGSIANDRMFYVIDNFFIGNITDFALVNSLSALKLGRQYVTVSQKGCDAVRIESEIPLSYIEKLAMKDVADENRAKGISLANDICKKYRREGKFFDEILDEAKGVF